MECFGVKKREKREKKKEKGRLRRPFFLIVLPRLSAFIRIRSWLHIRFFHMRLHAKHIAV